MDKNEKITDHMWESVDLSLVKGLGGRYQEYQRLLHLAEVDEAMEEYAKDQTRTQGD